MRLTGFRANGLTKMDYSHVVGAGGGFRSRRRLPTTSMWSSTARSRRRLPTTSMWSSTARSRRRLPTTSMWSSTARSRRRLPTTSMWSSPRRQACQGGLIGWRHPGEGRGRFPGRKMYSGLRRNDEAAGLARENVCSRQERQERQGNGEMTEDKIGQQNVDLAVWIHRELGPGLQRLPKETLI
jgi:hypothetical protein